ncbi:MAG: hypothetical protein MUP24_06155 [Gillisia sp.]|nr:hypothetical protein [Gillisia sp.]
MKKISNIFYLIVLALFIYSCSSSNNERPIGGGSDNIKLSINDVAFKSTTDSITIKTQGDSWWFAEVIVDKNEFDNFPGIDIFSDQFTIKQDCFVVERRDKNTLFIKLTENTTSLERIVFVLLEDGDYFATVKITQAPK